MLKLAQKSDGRNFCSRSVEPTMFFWKILRNRLRKRALFVSWRPLSIIKMFWNLGRKSCLLFTIKFNRQVMSSLLRSFLTAESTEISANPWTWRYATFIKETKQLYCWGWMIISIWMVRSQLSAMMGAVMRSSLCRVKPSPVHTHEGTPMRSCCNFFIFEAKSLICSLVGAFLLLSRGVTSFWCQVCFSPLLL